MASIAVNAPFTQISDVDGEPLKAGYVYVGEYEKDAETFPIDIFWDEALTIPAENPVRTLNGYYSRSGTPSNLFCASINHSITVKNKNGTLVFSGSSSVSDLSLEIIATAQNTTADNVSFLALGNVDGVNYFFDVDSEVTYYSLAAISGLITLIGSDDNGIRTIVVDSTSYDIYSLNIKDRFDSVATAQNTTSDNVSFLSLGIVSGVNYLYDAETEVTYYSSSPVSGLITSIGGDIDGIRTIVADSISYDIYSIDIKENIGSILEKEYKAIPAFYVDGSDLKVSQRIKVLNGESVFLFESDSSITVPALSSAVDYKIYCLSDGSLSAQDFDSTAPSGAVAIGGFHSAYGDSTIVPNSIWDLRWLPSGKSPRGCALSNDGRVWGDIYLMDEEYGIYGYSRPNEIIADDSNPPVIPDLYGGNGVTKYSGMTWFNAWDLAINAGKRLPSWGEFTGLAYGVVEQQSVGTDPITTKYQAGQRSACGLEQATGCMWQWCADTQGSGGTQNAITDGRGSVYASQVTAAPLGGNWTNGTGAGSRAASWNSSPSNSYDNIGARAVCDHLIL